MRKLLLGLAALTLGAGVTTASLPAQAAEGVAIPKQSWSFSGMFGTYDRAASQRGLQVFREVCSACHGLKRVAFRNLMDLGYSEDDIKALAAEYSVEDGPDDEGEMFERAARPSDRYPSPFPNDIAAAVANNGAAPPDLSLMTKARVGGPDYLYALLTGYVDPPADVEMMDGLSYNAYFPGHQIAMANPLFEDGVEYADGTAATVDQMAYDVTNFLMWAADPKLEERKGMGLKVIIFLIFMTAVFYAAKRKIWTDLH